MRGGRTKVHFDGGCRPNPGRMEAAVALRGDVVLFEDMGQGSHVDAEWLALIHALELVLARGIAEADLIGDSLDIVRRAQAVLADPASAGPGHATRFASLAQGAPGVRVRWIRRAQNLAGIALNRRHPR